MACQALGRCRICARKHKIAVFGGEESQHFFIEKANLKLIILNSVCVVCIAKIEKFVDKMDLDTVFGDSGKEETDSRRGIESPKPASLSCDSEGETFESTDKGIKIEQFDLEGDDNSESMPLKIDDTRSQRESTTSKCDVHTSRNDATDESDAQAPFTHRGDSRTRSFPHPAAPQRIGQDKLASGDEPCRKRPMIRFAADAMSVIQSTASKPIVHDCVSGAKKGTRFLRCDFCNKEFTHAGDMNKHRRKHTGEKPYECNQCQRKFAHASNLARHQRVHSGERPFACTKCGRAFTRRDKLSIHIAADRCTQLDQNESLISQAEITES